MKKLDVNDMADRNPSGQSTNESVKRLPVSSIVGSNIFNTEGVALGKIKDIMISISESRVEYIVIEFGGFLGVNQKYFAVPFKALSIARERSRAFILNETKESLKRYPGFDKDHWPDTNSHILTSGFK